MIKLTVISQTFGLGGAETFFTDLFAQWQQQGIDLDFYTNNRRWQRELRQQRIATQHIPFDLDIIGDWKGLLKAIICLPYAVWFFWRVIKESKQTDGLLLPGFGEKIFCTLLAKMQHVPVVWVEFGPLETVFAKFYGLPKWLYFLAKDYPRKIIVSSEHTKQHLITGAYIAADKLMVIPCGRTAPAAKLVDRVRSESEEPLIVCVSRLEPGKGQDLLIRAMAKIVKQLPLARLKIVGEGDWLASLQTLAQQLAVDKNIVFTGRVTDAWQELAAADVVVCPSVWELEGFGMVAIEAMALGKPVVGFDRGPTNELVQHQINGLLAESGNIDKLAAQIIRLLQNPQLAQKLGTAGRQIFNKQYRIDHAARQYTRILQTCLSHTS